MIAGQGTYIIILCNFSLCDTTTWVLDTESPTYWMYVLEARLAHTYKTFLGYNLYN